MYDVTDNRTLQDIILPTPVEKLWIAPSRIALAVERAGEMDAHFRLASWPIANPHGHRLSADARHSR